MRIAPSPSAPARDMHNAAELQQQLAAAGAEEYRRTYRRHGVRGELYGVSYATQKALARQIKTDLALALALWESGNHDARVLATMIADPVCISAGELRQWATDVDNSVLGDAFVALATRTPHAQTLFEQWADSPNEWLGASAWALLSGLAQTPNDLPDEYFMRHLATLEREIHGRPDRVRHAMNGAVIGIGSRNAALRSAATAAAKRIGKVAVDHGETGCKTPDAGSYIEKVWARKKPDVRS